MKNILTYFYQIVISTSDIDERGYFFYNNSLFCIKEYIRSIPESKSLLILNNYMLVNNIKVNRIILNINNEVLSFYNNKYYILLKIDYQKLAIMNFNFINAPKLKDLDNLKRNDWAYLWSSKVDYIEYQIEHLKNKYKILYDTVYYYIGLAENAIMYFKMLNLNNEELFICHRRLTSEEDFFNPIDLIIDYRVRDISEYFKNCFFNNKMNSNDIINYLSKINFSKTDYILLYTRMLYPSYYFDMYDKIINNIISENDILKITNLSKEYEILLKNLGHLIKHKVNLLEITWLN